MRELRDWSRQAAAHSYTNSALEHLLDATSVLDKSRGSVAGAEWSLEQAQECIRRARAILAEPPEPEPTPEPPGIMASLWARITSRRQG